MNRRLPVLLVIAWIASIGACAPKPPPPRAVEEPPAAPPPPPPPPPKCEALEEGCIATGAQAVALEAVGWTIKPPAGWKYAREGALIVAVSEKAAVTLTTFEASSAKGRAEVKARNARRDEALARSIGRLGIERKKKLVYPPKPHKSSRVQGVDVSLYQFDGATRSGETGPLLVFTAQLTPTRALLGVAFVAERDTTNADAAVLKAIDSLVPEASDAGAPDTAPSK
jgi:hypothetical protein